MFLDMLDFNAFHRICVYVCAVTIKQTVLRYEMKNVSHISYIERLLL